MVEQWAIAVLGVSAVLLSQQKNSYWQRYACIFGLAAQPFWFYTCIQQQQWGILVVSVFYTFAWAIGFRHHWLKF